MTSSRCCLAFGTSLVLLLAAGRRACGQSLQAPETVLQGGTIDVQVGPNDSAVQVSSGPGSTTTHDVPGTKAVTIPVPPVAGGTMLVVTVGKGLRRRVVLVEVIAP